MKYDDRYLSNQIFREHWQLTRGVNLPLHRLQTVGSRALGGCVSRVEAPLPALMTDLAEYQRQNGNTKQAVTRDSWVPPVSRIRLERNPKIIFRRRSTTRRKPLSFFYHQGQLSTADLPLYIDFAQEHPALPPRMCPSRYD